MESTSTIDYLKMLLSFNKTAPITVLSLFFLGLFRLAPIVSLAPFLGAKLPIPVRIGLAISLNAVILPHIIATTVEPIGFDAHFIGLALKEVCIGILIALLVSFPFYIAQGAGVLIDFLRGSSSLMVQDPTMQTQVSPIGILYNYVLIVLFFQIDGLFYFLESLFQSYSLLPTDRMIPPALFSLKLPLWQTLTELLTQFTSLSIQFAAPSVIAILMAEAFLGIANRLAPQVQIAFLGMSLKSLIGLAMLWAGWFFILQQMGKQTLAFLENFIKLLVTMKS